MPAPRPHPWWDIITESGKFSSSCASVQSAAKPAAKPGQTVEGPFATQDEAKRACGRFTGNPPPAPLNPFGFLAWLQDIGHWLGVLIANITDIHMWISLAWLLLGGFLLLIGLWLWVRGTKFYQELQQQATQAAAVAAAA